MRLLPIGSIIEINSVKLIILGTEYIDMEQKFGFNYLVSLYPVGITNENSIFSVSVDSNYYLIHKGYEDNTGKDYLNEHEGLYSEMKEISPSELADFFDDFSKFIISKNKTREVKI